MPRYFFHLDHGVKRIPDREGHECADAAAATEYAIRTIREMLADDLRAGRVELGWKIRIEDASGGQLASITSGDVLSGRISPPTDPSPRH